MTSGFFVLKNRIHTHMYTQIRKKNEKETERKTIDNKEKVAIIYTLPMWQEQNRQIIATEE